MIVKLTITFEKTLLTKYEEDSKPHVVCSWTDEKFYRTAEEKDEILNAWKKNEHKESFEISAMPYRQGMVEQIYETKIKSILEIPVTPVTKYFFMYSETIGVNECSDEFGGTEYSEEVSNWSKSEYFDDEETAFLESTKFANVTPIMKGVVYEF